jgi:hypothetical protein
MFLDRYTKYEEALNLYFLWEYQKAWRIFELESNIDSPSAVLAKRCLDILEGRLHVEGGVYKMEHK